MCIRDRVNTEDMAAFQPLEAMLSRADRWNDLYSVYRDAIRDTLDMDRKKALLFKVSALQEDKLDDPTAAIGTFREIIDLDSEDEQATRALDRLYTTLGRYQDLAELLLRRIERADRSGAVELGKWSELTPVSYTHLIGCLRSTRAMKVRSWLSPACTKKRSASRRSSRSCFVRNRAARTSRRRSRCWKR